MNGDCKTNKRDLEDMNDNGSSASKKARLDEAEPSKVLHLRNLPTNLISAELIAMGAAFGRVDKHYFIKDRTQALLQLGSLEEAQAMVEHFTNNKPQINGREIYVQYSRRQEITINNGIHQASQDNASAVTAGATANLMLPYGVRMEGGTEAASPISSTYNTIIRVTHENATYALDLDSSHKVFSKFGKVLKIVTFHRNNQQGALIQYSSSKEATMAIGGLHQKSLYGDGSYLKVELSRLGQLEVRENGKRSWDFTKDPNMPASIQQPTLATAMPYATLGMIPSFHHPLLAAAACPSPFGLQPTAMLPAAPTLVASTGSPVAIVSNLHEERITPDALFILFGVYGNVLRVKILFNKKGTALIQMADPCQVKLAIQYLDRLPLYGQQMRVNESKNSQVHLPRPGDSVEASQLTKDYSTSPLHRFKKPGSKNYHNIFPPSAVLHLSNIPQDCTEQTLREALHTVAEVQNIVAFKFLMGDKKMALVQLESVQEAAQALIKLHNYKLSDSNHLRVSFSKAVI